MEKTHCKCIQEIEAGLQKKMGYENKPSIHYEFLSGRTYSKVTIREANPRCKSGYKDSEISLLHSYCPFCGKPYTKEDDQP